MHCAALDLSLEAAIESASHVLLCACLQPAVAENTIGFGFCLIVWCLVTGLVCVRRCPKLSGVCMSPDTLADNKFVNPCRAQLCFQHALSSLVGISCLASVVGKVPVPQHLLRQ